jgi:hypothetical protein
MIGMKLAQAKGLFFDRQAVTNAADRAQRKVLSKFGAFVRQAARTSIRKRKSISEPGQPPSSYTGLLKRNIFFLFSPQTRSVVIGPILLNKGIDALRILEHGDTVVRKKRTKRVRMKYRARPYMGPAFEKEQSRLPALWRNSVK